MHIGHFPFQHYFHQLWIVTNAFFPKCTFLYLCVPQVVPKSADMKILTLHNFTCKSTQRQAPVVPNIRLSAAWSGCDTSLQWSLSCWCVSVWVEKKFSSVLQRFNWSQSECGTLSQYVGHETRDGDAVQSHKKSWTNDFWIFSRKKWIHSLTQSCNYWAEKYLMVYKQRRAVVVLPMEVNTCVDDEVQFKMPVIYKSLFFFFEMS